MSLINALNWRYAVNKFSEQTLNPNQISGLVESVRLAPASYGIQPYQLIVVATDENKHACLPHSFGQNKVENCSHLLVLAHKTELTQRDVKHFINRLAETQNKPVNDFTQYQQQIESDLLARSPQQQINWAKEQLYIALGTLLTYAADNQIDACPMTGFEIKGINQVLGLSGRGLSAAVLCPVGIRSVDDHTTLRPKYRISKEELVIKL